MIYFDCLQKFISVVNDLKNTDIQVHLYGKAEEKFTGSYAGFTTPPNNILSIRIVALTSVGTLYCHESIKLKDTAEIEKAKQLYEQLSISEANISYKSETGTVTIR